MKTHDGVLTATAGALTVGVSALLRPCLPKTASAVFGYGLAHLVIGAALYVLQENPRLKSRATLPIGKLKLTL